MCQALGQKDEGTMVPTLRQLSDNESTTQVLSGMREEGICGLNASPHYGVGASFVVVERVVVNGMPAAMEIIRQVHECVTAIQQ